MRTSSFGRSAALALLALLPASGCERRLKSFPGPLVQVEKRLSTHRFDPSKPLADRIGPCPPLLLKVYRKLDGRPDYQSHTPTPEEKALVLEYLETLPEGMRAAFQEKLIGIYFIKNLLGNGLADFVMDERDPKAGTWVVIYLNPAGFGRTLSQTVALRETSVFGGDSGVSIDCGTKYRGILYSIVHEGAHAYDYIRGITPYTEPAILEARGEAPPAVKWDVWDGYFKHGPEASSPWWGRLKFYGFGGGPLIEAGNAPRVYEDLIKSPFPSLYATMNWADDAAELVLFHHLTQKLGQPYVVTVAGAKGTPARRFEPMKEPRIQARAKRIYDAI